MVKTTDAANNAVVVVNDYRVLAPVLITDPNGNHTAASFDVLGMVAGTASDGQIYGESGRLTHRVYR